jgi:hypothetical protein
VLRSIEKKRTYPTVENAQAELTLLQQEYPHAAVPGANKRYVMIFGRAEGKEKRVKKYVLEIKQAEGKPGYIIECTLNESKPKPVRPKPPSASAATPAKPVGDFTAKLALKRNKKK